MVVDPDYPDFDFEAFFTTCLDKIGSDFNNCRHRHLEDIVPEGCAETYSNSYHQFTSKYGECFCSVVEKATKFTTNRDTLDQAIKAKNKWSGERVFVGNLNIRKKAPAIKLIIAEIATSVFGDRLKKIMMCGGLGPGVTIWTTSKIRRKDTNLFGKSLKAINHRFFPGIKPDIGKMCHYWYLATISNSSITPLFKLTVDDLLKLRAEVEKDEKHT